MLKLYQIREEKAIMKESILYQKLKDDIAKCQTCSHFCVIAPGKRGICGVRKNKSGKLQVLNYGRVVAANVDPVEKKTIVPFYAGN